MNIIYFRSLYIIHGLSNSIKFDSKNSIDYRLLTKKSNYVNKTKVTHKQVNILKILLMICASTYALAFLLWNIDNIYCNHLIDLRKRYPAWSFLFQFHGKKYFS